MAYGRAPASKNQSIMWSTKIISGIPHRCINSVRNTLLISYTSVYEINIKPISLLCLWESHAHLRAVLSATITRADAPSRAAWHHAVQQRLRRAAAGLLCAKPAAAVIMMRVGQWDSNPETLSKASFFTFCPSVTPPPPAAATLPTKISDVTSGL